MTGTARLRQWLVCVAVVATLGGFAWWSLLHRYAPSADVARPRITIATPTQIGAGTVRVGMDQKLFEQRGLDVVAQPFTLGKQALEALLQGHADLAILADTPFMLAIMRGEEIATLGTIFGSRSMIVLVVRKDSGISTATQLAGKKIGTVVGTNLHFFLDDLLTINRVDKSSIKLVDMKATEMVSALQHKTVDAVTLFSPDFAKAQNALGSQIARVQGEDIFAFRLLLVGKQEYLRTHQAELRQFIAALEDANAFIRDKPAQARTIIAKSMDMDQALLVNSFHSNDFQVSLDQTLLLALDDKTRWAVKQRMVTSAIHPNYLDFIWPGPLASVRADGVRIIQ